jgi:NAD(P)-dependent dehydrogenase (short-subunit alcohol dehydrogenase family)
MSIAARQQDPAPALIASGRRKLEGRVAVITGGAKGMGGTIAELFALEGAHLVLAARDLAALTAELERLRALVPKPRYKPWSNGRRASLARSMCW